MAGPTKEGDYRGEIISGSVMKGNESAWFWNVHVALKEVWDKVNKKWVTVSDSRMSAWGKLYLRKKDGTANATMISSIARAFSLADDDKAVGKFAFDKGADGLPVGCSIKASEGGEKVYFNVDWLAPYEGTPGVRGGKPMDAAEAAEYAEAFGLDAPKVEEIPDDLAF